MPGHQDMLAFDARLPLRGQLEDATAQWVVVVRDMFPELLAAAMADNSAADLRSNPAWRTLVGFVYKDCRSGLQTYLSEALRMYRVSVSSLFPDWMGGVSSEVFFQENVDVLYGDSYTPRDSAALNTFREVQETATETPQEMIVMAKKGSLSSISDFEQALQRNKLTVSSLAESIAGCSLSDVVVGIETFRDTANLSTLAQGALINRVQQEGLWQDWNGAEYDSFAEWCWLILGYKKRKAEHLSSIFRSLEELDSQSDEGISVGLFSRIVSVGWSKLYMILKVTTLELLDYWVGKAEICSVRELEKLVRAAESGLGDEHGERLSGDEDSSGEDDYDADLDREDGGEDIKLVEETFSDANFDENGEVTQPSRSEPLDVVSPDDMEATKSKSGQVSVSLRFSDYDDYQLFNAAIERGAALVGYDAGIGKLLATMALSYLSTSNADANGGALADVMSMLTALERTYGVKLAVRSEDGSPWAPVSPGEHDGVPPAGGSSVVLDAEASPSKKKTSKKTTKKASKKKTSKKVEDQEEGSSSGSKKKASKKKAEPKKKAQPKKKASKKKDVISAAESFTVHFDGESGDDDVQSISEAIEEYVLALPIADQRRIGQALKQFLGGDCMTATGKPNSGDFGEALFTWITEMVVDGVVCDETTSDDLFSSDSIAAVREYGAFSQFSYPDSSGDALLEEYDLEDEYSDDGLSGPDWDVDLDGGENSDDESEEDDFGSDEDFDFDVSDLS